MFDIAWKCESVSVWECESVRKKEFVWVKWIHFSSIKKKATWADSYFSSACIFLKTFPSPYRFKCSFSSLLSSHAQMTFPSLSILPCFWYASGAYCAASAAALSGILDSETFAGTSEWLARFFFYWGMVMLIIESIFYYWIRAGFSDLSTYQYIYIYILTLKSAFSPMYTYIHAYIHAAARPMKVALGACPVTAFLACFHFYIFSYHHW